MSDHETHSPALHAAEHVPNFQAYIYVFLALCVLSCASAPGPARSSASQFESGDQLAADLEILLTPDTAGLAPVLQRVAAARDRRFIAPLIELIRFRPPVDRKVDGHQVGLPERDSGGGG